MLSNMSTEATNDPWKYLTQKRGSYYRQLYVFGRIRATTIYDSYLSRDVGEPGMSPEELAENFDVPIEAVREAIAYVESNPPEIKQDWEADERVAEATGMNDPNYKYHPSPKILSPEEWERLNRR